MWQEQGSPVRCAWCGRAQAQAPPPAASEMRHPFPSRSTVSKPASPKCSRATHHRHQQRAAQQQPKGSHAPQAVRVPLLQAACQVHAENACGVGVGVGAGWGGLGWAGGGCGEAAEDQAPCWEGLDGWVVTWGMVSVLSPTRRHCAPAVWAIDRHA